MILPIPGTSPSGKSLFGTLPFPSSPIVTTIGMPFLPGISTVVPGGYVDPSGFLGVTVTSPVFGSCSNTTVGVLRAGVVTTGTSTGSFPGSVILAVPGTFPSGKSLFGTLPFPSFPIITTIGLSLFLPGISTFVFSGYNVPSGFLGVTVTSPESGSCSNSTVGVLREGVVTLTFSSGFPDSIILPVPGTSPSGKSLFGTFPLPSSPIVTMIGVPFLPGISTIVPGG